MSGNLGYTGSHPSHPDRLEFPSGSRAPLIHGQARFLARNRSRWPVEMTGMSPDFMYTKEASGKL